MVQCHRSFWCFLSSPIIPFISFWRFLIICAAHLLFLPPTSWCWAWDSANDTSSPAGYLVNIVKSGYLERDENVERGEASCSFACYSRQKDPKAAPQPKCSRWFQFLTSLRASRTSLLILPWRAKQWLNSARSSEDWDPAPLGTPLQSPDVVGATGSPLLRGPSPNAVGLLLCF